MIRDEYPELTDRETLAGFVDNGMSIRDIAVRVACSKYAVESALRHHGLSRRRVRVPEEVKKKLRI